MNVYLRRVGFVAIFGVLCVANVHAMSSGGGQEGQSATQSGDAKPCIQASGWVGRLLGYCMVPENRTGFSRPVCAGARLLDGRDYCRPSQQGVGEESAGKKTVVNEQTQGEGVKQEHVAVAAQQIAVPVVKEQPKQFPDSPAVNKLPDGHVLKIDISNPYGTVPDDRLGKKACRGLDWLKWHSGKHAGNAVVEEWARGCKKDKPFTQQEFDTELKGQWSPIWGRAQSLDNHTNRLAAICFHTMRQLDYLNKYALAEEIRDGALGDKACSGWQSLYDQVKMGFRSFDEQQRVEINAGVEICGRRKTMGQETERRDRVDGRLAYGWSDFLARAGLGQYAARPGYALDISDLHEPGVSFLQGYLGDRYYNRIVVRQACEGLAKLAEVMAKGQPNALQEQVNIGLEMCEKREEWSSSQDTLLVADGALVEVSSDLFMRWQNAQTSWMPLMWHGSVKGMETLQALSDGRSASSIPYNARLGDDLCRGEWEASETYHCSLRKDVLTSAGGKKAVADNNPLTVEALRCHDIKMAFKAYEKVRNGERDVYTQDRLRGFCLHK